ncbi:hypothetical protein [Algoriphagus sp. AK58]|uniref:hypothetical protein n=1 Tax=Algoriphagus sp. AK58 TaxID=1406877 RepID=UPI00164FF1F2|nr:hypothetical protein [Algoriphagus sp. AK58]MBC6366571.1 hypothetical protein [Algoriphagus sp. AK58]
MIKKSILYLAFFITSFTVYSQSNSDTLFLLEGQMEVKIKEVGLNNIKYTYPDEETVYTISRYQVSKIVFASGREEVFESPIKPVKGLDDFEKVFITYNPEDISGLQSKGELFSKATGVTTLSSINQVKNRALDKLKAEAAMTGANIVFIGNIYQRGNQYGGENQAGNSTQTTFSGVGYSTKKIKLETVKSQIESRTFHHYQTHKLNRNSWSPERSITTQYGPDRKPIMFKINEVVEKEGELFVKTDGLPTKTRELQIIHCDDEALILMERNEKVTINYYLITDQNKYFKNLASRVIL